MELPVGCGNVSQATLGWSLRTVVLQPFGTEVDFFFFFFGPKTSWFVHPILFKIGFCFRLSPSVLDAQERATCWKLRLKNGN